MSADPEGDAAAFIEEFGREPDAQELHDWTQSRKRAGLATSLRGSKARLQRALKRKNGRSGEPPGAASLDPISAAVRDNPGLNPEKAAELAEKLGF